MSVFNKSKEGKSSLSPTLIIISIDRFTVISSFLYHHKLRYFCLWYRLTDSVLVIYKSSVTLQVKVTQKVHQNVARLCLHTVCNVCILVREEDTECRLCNNTRHLPRSRVLFCSTLHE